MVGAILAYTLLLGLIIDYNVLGAYYVRKSLVIAHMSLLCMLCALYEQLFVH